MSEHQSIQGNLDTIQRNCLIGQDILMDCNLLICMRTGYLFLTVSVLVDPRMARLTKVLLCSVTGGTWYINHKLVELRSTSLLLFVKSLLPKSICGHFTPAYCTRSHTYTPSFRVMSLPRLICLLSPETQTLVEHCTFQDPGQAASS
jgi:hypothetical protein